MSKEATVQMDKTLGNTNDQNAEYNMFAVVLMVASAGEEITLYSHVPISHNRTIWKLE